MIFRGYPNAVDIFIAVFSRKGEKLLVVRFKLMQFWVNCERWFCVNEIEASLSIAEFVIKIKFTLKTAEAEKLWVVVLFRKKREEFNDKTSRNKSDRNKSFVIKASP